MTNDESLVGLPRSELCARQGCRPSASLIERACARRRHQSTPLKPRGALGSGERFPSTQEYLSPLRART